MIIVLYCIEFEFEFDRSDEGVSLSACVCLSSDGFELAIRSDQPIASVGGCFGTFFPTDFDCICSIQTANPVFEKDTQVLLPYVHIYIYIQTP